MTTHDIPCNHEGMFALKLGRIDIERLSPQEICCEACVGRELEHTWHESFIARLRSLVNNILRTQRDSARCAKFHHSGSDEKFAK